MEIRYSLTRSELTLSFLQGLAKSPKLLARVLLYCLIPAVTWTAMSGTFAGGVTAGALRSVLLWVIGTFFVMVLFLYLTAKTAQRTMTVGADGISTTIGKRGGEVGWNKIADVKDAGDHVLVMGRSGNTFFIPDRAFDGQDQKRQFISDSREWRARTPAKG